MSVGTLLFLHVAPSTLVFFLLFFLPTGTLQHRLTGGWVGLCSSVMGLCSSKDEKNGADTVRSHLVRCEKSTYYIAFLRGGIFFPSISRGKLMCTACCTARCSSCRLPCLLLNISRQECPTSGAGTPSRTGYTHSPFDRSTRRLPEPCAGEPCYSTLTTRLHPKQGNVR